MLNEFQNFFNLSITLSGVIQNIVIALICGLIISFFYRQTYKGPGYSVSFINSLVILSMITSVVIMVIGNNLARAFGLVGAMSIIRFRTAVKDTLDIVYIFFSLAIGMAAGVGLHFIAVSSTVIIGAILLFLSKTNLITPPRQDYLLQFTFEEDGETKDAPYVPVIEKYCRKNNLMNVKSVGSGEFLELSYYVDLRSKKKSPEFLREIKKIKGISHVNLFFDEENF